MRQHSFVSTISTGNKTVDNDIVLQHGNTVLTPIAVFPRESQASKRKNSIIFTFASVGTRARARPTLLRPNKNVNDSA